MEEYSDIRWHFIGHLQKNKVNQLLKTPNLTSIQTIDRLELVHLLLKKELKHKIDVFLQINTSGEEEKFGFSPDEDLTAIVEILNSNPQFNLKGLMTIGRVRTQNFENDARKSFEKLKDLKLKLDKDHKLNLKLSMGMSQDLEIAKEVGTDIVRVGTDIFGPRL